jgi:hypothetical protein
MGKRDVARKCPCMETHTMGLFDLFKKKGKDPVRTAKITGTTGPRYYDALAAQLKGNTGLGAESIEKIKAALAPLAKVGGKIDDALAQVKVEIDLSEKPTKMVMRTLVGAKPVGPATSFVVTHTGPTSCTCVGTITMPSGGSISDRLMMAAIASKIKNDSQIALDEPMAEAAKTIKAEIRFE